MVKAALDSFFNQAIYVQLARDWLMVRDPRTGRSVADVPELALQQEGGKTIIVGAGAMARQAEAAMSGVTVVNPFAHPRTLISDFTAAVEVLKLFLERLQPQPLGLPFRLSPNPRMVLHPLGSYEGGLTQVELRALHELALGAGAAEAVVWEGPALRDEQVLEHTFPPEGSVLVA